MAKAKQAKKVERVRYETPKAITGKAATPAAMAAEYRKATGCDGADALGTLIRKGYAKVCAEIKYALAHPPKKARKPAKRPAKKAWKPARKSAGKGSRAVAAAKQTQDPQIAAGMV